MIKDFFKGFLAAITEGIKETTKKISDDILSIGISIALIGAGLFLTIWGIATAIDRIFAMNGFGYVMIGIMAILTGIIYRKRR